MKKGSDDSIRSQGQISIDASTGNVVNLYSYGYGESGQEKFQPKITWEQAYDKAIDIITKYYPEKIKDIKTEQKNLNSSDEKLQSPEYTYLRFDFPRLVNGITYKNDGINIAFNTKTGQINEIQSVWQKNIDAPVLDNVISTDAAIKVIFDKNGPKLMYKLFPNYDKTDKTDGTIKLVYSTDEINGGFGFVDAFTGKLLNYDGQEIDDNIEAFKAKIKGSSVEKEATILASNGVIETKDFSLDGNVTKLQLIKLLVNAKGYRPYLLTDGKGLNFSTSIAKDSTDYKYLQLAVKYGVLEDGTGEFNAQQLVTRKEAAKALLKFLKYDKVAELQGIFNVQATDKDKIENSYIGYISIAEGLNIIQTDKAGNIRPDADITMEELVKAAYTAIGNVQPN